MFNSTVEEHKETAKKEVEKVCLQHWKMRRQPSQRPRLSLTKVVVRQKHIKIADCSKLGLGIVAANENGKLAENLDDEKRLFKAEKEAEKKKQKKKKKLKEKTKDVLG